MHKLGLFLLFTTVFFVGYSQENVIRGFIYDKSNGEVISDVKVKLLRTDSSIVAQAISNNSGFFAIPKLAKGKYILKIDDFKYKLNVQNVELGDKRQITDVRFDLSLPDKSVELGMVKITAKKEKTHIDNGKITLGKRELEKIPSYGAENDIVAGISVTPGVITTGDQGGQLYVRGGTPIQNKILLDGMTIYSPFHSIGFFSVFETELVKSMDIYTGGFDARYGGRISSVMDITYRDGNKQQFGGKVSASPFLAKLVLEGPFGKKNANNSRAGAYVFSAKQSLLDYSSKSLYPQVNDGNGLPFNFTDLYGKFTISSDGGSKFSAFAFHNRDSVQYDVANLSWKASGGGVNFLLVPSGSPIFIRGHVNGSEYETTFTELEQQPRFSKIGGFDLGFDFSYFLKNEGEMNYGFNLNGFNTQFVTYNESKTKIKAENFNTEIGTYYTFRKVSRRWVFQAGIRGQFYASLATFSPEPRIGLKYNATENLRFKFSGGRYSQNFTSASSDKDVVNLFNGLLSAPRNVQEEFVNEFNKVKATRNGLQYAWHAILGMDYDLGKSITFSLEGYYKYFSQLSNINQNKLYPDEAQFENISDVFKKDFIIESGQSFGFDILAKYSQDRIFLWGVYSFGYNTRWDGFRHYFPVFDRRHNINVVASYLLGKKKDIEANLRWNLGSGLPFTPTAGNYQAETFSNGLTTDYVTNNPSTISTILGGFNSERLPFYHRLDVTVKKQFNFKNKDVLELVGSVTNAYNRNNIFYVNRVSSKKIYQFPILPSFGLSYKF